MFVSFVASAFPVYHLSGFCGVSDATGQVVRQSGVVRSECRCAEIKAVGRGRVDANRPLFKQVVTSSKSGLWDEVAVTQIGSLTSPYLPACAMAASGLLSCLQSLPRILRTIITPSRTPLRGEPPVHLATLNSLFLSLCALGVNPSFFHLPANDIRASLHISCFGA